MSDSDKSSLISQFSGVTGADADRARFYLESAAWKLDLALGSFYDQGDAMDEDDDLPATDTMRPAVPTVSAGSPGPSPAGPAISKKSTAKQSRFGTIGSMRDQATDPEDSGDEHEAYYAGGSEHGAGQQLLGRKKKNSDSLVKDMFKAAKDHGAEEVSGGEASGISGTIPKTFKGTAYRLGDTDAPSVSVRGMPVNSAPRQVNMVLKMWKGGFSVDTGPLRRYDSPESREFLDSIKKGEIPKELIREAKGGEVSLNMEDHRQEEYIKPKLPIKAFTGEGMRLGSPADASDTRESVSTLSGDTTAAAAGSNQTPVQLSSHDESKPSTNIQIRLADGSRLVARFNNTQTVADVRQYIINSRSESASANFILMTTFPNKELTDESQTLECAKLMNALLVQKII